MSPFSRDRMNYLTLASDAVHDQQHAVYKRSETADDRLENGLRAHSPL